MDQNKTRRSSIGARIKVTLDEGRRYIYRTINTGGSFGANSLQQHIGIGLTKKIDEVEIFWPTSNQKQTFRNLQGNQSIFIKEGEKSFSNVKETEFSYDS